MPTLVTLIFVLSARGGVLMLGVTKPNGDYVGAPKGELCLEPGDNLLLYGRSQILEGLQKR